MWIDKDTLTKEGIHGNIVDNPDFVLKLANLTLSCSLPADDLEINRIVSQVQKHHHTKSCRKTGKSCRFGFPKLPMPETVVAQPISEDICPAEKDALLKRAKEVLTKAVQILEDPDIDEDMTFEAFLEKLQVTRGDYLNYCNITERGKVLLLKRDIKERNINTYNPEWIRAWNANMDMQIALDPFAIITYIVSYVSKDESGMTEFLKEALAATYNSPQEDKLKALKIAYLNHRQVGASEAVYRLIHDMRLRNSNITCIWVSSGFPENRYVNFRKVSDEDPEQHEDNAAVEDLEEEGEENVSYNPQAVKLKDKQGTFQQSISVHERYALRPDCLKDMCLAQFASAYTFTSRVPATTKFTSDGSSENRSTRIIFGTTITLPNYAKVEEK